MVLLNNEIANIRLVYIPPLQSGFYPPAGTTVFAPTGQKFAALLPTIDRIDHFANAGTDFHEPL